MQLTLVLAVKKSLVHVKNDSFHIYNHSLIIFRNLTLVLHFGELALPGMPQLDV
jgi:hypothetical protein